MRVEEFRRLVIPIMTKYGQLCDAIIEIEADLGRAYLDLLAINGVEAETMTKSLKAMTLANELHAVLSELSDQRCHNGDADKIRHQVYSLRETVE